MGRGEMVLSVGGDAGGAQRVVVGGANETQGLFVEFAERGRSH